MTVEAKILHCRAPADDAGAQTKAGNFACDNLFRL